jgi:soluble lytic murein transglycosylase-like protein
MIQINTASDTSIKSSTFLHQIILVLGVAALTISVLMFVKPGFTNQFQSISPYAKVEIATEESQSASKVTTANPTSNNKPHSKQQQSVANWLAKRYRVANDASHLFVSAAYQTAKEFKLDPLLILSVMAIESGLNPFAESAAGAQGLMQVMSKIHHDKFKEFGGVKAALDPHANIRVGTQILKEYVTRAGSVEAGLKMYVGAALAENDGGYGSKVLAEYKRLKDVSNGKAVPTINTASMPVTKAKPAVAEVQDKSGIINTEMNEQLSDRHVDPELVAAI